MGNESKIAIKKGRANKIQCLHNSSNNIYYEALSPLSARRKKNKESTYLSNFSKKNFSYISAFVKSPQRSLKKKEKTILTVFDYDNMINQLNKKNKKNFDFNFKREKLKKQSGETANEDENEFETLDFNCFFPIKEKENDTNEPKTKKL